MTPRPPLILLICLLLLVGVVSANTLITNETVSGILYHNTDGSSASMFRGNGEDVVVNAEVTDKGLKL